VDTTHELEAFGDDPLIHWHFANGAWPCRRSEPHGNLRPGCVYGHRHSVVKACSQNWTALNWPATSRPSYHDTRAYSKEFFGVHNFISSCMM